MNISTLIKNAVVKTNSLIKAVVKEMWVINIAVFYSV